MVLYLILLILFIASNAFKISIKNKLIYQQFPLKSCNYQQKLISHDLTRLHGSIYPRISLDCPIIPSRNSNAQVLNIMVSVIAIFIAYIMKTFYSPQTFMKQTFAYSRSLPSSEDVSDESYFEESSFSNSDIYTDKIIRVVSNIKKKITSWKQRIVSEFIPSISLGLRVFAAKCEYLIESILDKFKQIVSRGNTYALNTEAWNYCRLQDREELPGKYIRYRFNLPFKKSTVSLSLGQQILLCAVGESNNVVKESFFPSSPSRAKGYFDVLLHNKRNTNEKESILDILESLSLGDEIAFKGGENKLILRGVTETIKSILIITTGLGISPTLQILNEILPVSDTTVENVEMIWCNAKKSDFLFDKDIEKLELRHFEKFIVTKVLDPKAISKVELPSVNEADASAHVDYTNEMFRTNPLIEESVAPYDAGRIAIVCGSKEKTQAFVEYLQFEKNYAKENIVLIDTNE